MALEIRRRLHSLAGLFNEAPSAVFVLRFRVLSLEWIRAWNAVSKALHLNANRLPFKVNSLIEFVVDRS